MEVIEIYCGTMWEIGLLQSILEDRGIPSFQNNQIRGAGWTTSANSINSIKLMINSKDYQQAKEIVDEFKKNRK